MTEICDWSDMPVESCQHCRDGKKITEELVPEPSSPILPDGRKKCAEDGCTNAVKQDHWSSIHAHGEGWFFQKNGLIWCPDHTPEWVEEWRASRD
jgi:hypothetical protein